MAVLSKTQHDNPLFEFCRNFGRKYGASGFHDPELLATEFRASFGLSPSPGLGELKKLAPRIGISSVESYKPVSEERGSFFKFGPEVHILIKEDDWDGSKEHTIGHELREIIGVTAKDAVPDFADVKGADLEYQADAFSAALLMDRSAFYTDMIATGYDPITLHYKYNKSYVSIVSRMARIADLKRPKEFIWTSVFESDPKAPPGYLRAKCFFRSPRYPPHLRRTIPNYLFPKSGQLVPIKGILRNAYDDKKGVYVQKLTGLDFWNMYSLSAIIRPVIWGINVAKLILIAIPESDSHKFEPQLRSITPILIKESFQVP